MQANKKIFNAQSSHFFAGSGEMVNLTNTYNWASSSLGPINNWPQSLHTTLSILLNSKFPMFLFWGANLICFYNDAYRPSLGNNGKHPSILGMKGEQAWPEIWDIIKPLIDQILSGGEATWSEDQLIPIYRNGKIEDVYWTFSYSAVIDETGNPAGVFVTCNETTDKVTVIKKIEESKNKLQFAIEATQLGTLDYDPLTNKFSANDRLKEWFGFEADTDDIKIEMALNAVAEEDKEKLESAIQTALDYSSGGNFNVEYTIINQVTNEKKLVNAKGRAWFNDDKIAYRLIGTLQDITEIKKAQLELEKTVRHLQITTDSANVGTWSLNVKSQVLEWSSVHKKMWGYKDDDQLTYESWHTLILPKDKELAFNRVEEARINHSFYETEYRIKKADNDAIRWIRSIGKYHYNNNGDAETLTGISIDITDRKDAEEISNYRKALLEAQNEAVPDGILVVDTKGAMLNFNKSFTKIWKIPTTITDQKDDNAALEFAMTQVINPEAFIDRVKECYANPDLKAHDELLLKDGRTLERYGNAVIGADGISYGWAWYFRDITEQRNIENTLKESEERFRNLADQTPLWVWIAGENVYVEYANQAILTFVGLNNYKEFTAHAWEKFVHSDDIQMVYEAIGKAKNEPVSFEFRVKKASTQNYEWVLIMAVPRVVENKFSGFIGTGININEQKLAMQQLTESEIRFRLLADSMPQFVWAGDAQGNLNYFNKSVYNYSGLTPEKIKTGGWLQIVHPDERDENVKQWLHAIKTGEDFNFEHRFQRHDGVYRWQLSRARPQKDVYGNIQMWVGTSTDIQEIKEQVQQKDEFISIASHEMKTPLTTAKGYLELLLHTLKQEDETSYLYANKANQSLGRLHNLVSELLDASKIQNGKLNYTITTFDFNTLVTETIQDIQHTSINHIIEKQGSLSKNITADRDRLQQVIINLLTNALKYSPKANKVLVNIEESENRVKISVQDFGVGMAKHHLDKIFDRYYRVQEHAIHFQGLGIGLYICYDIIKRHNGNMWAESEDGKGSIFYFELPI